MDKCCFIDKQQTFSRDWITFSRTHLYSEGLSDVTSDMTVNSMELSDSTALLALFRYLTTKTIKHIRWNCEGTCRNPLNHQILINWQTDTYRPYHITLMNIWNTVRAVFGEIIYKLHVRSLISGDVVGWNVIFTNKL